MRQTIVIENVLFSCDFHRWYSIGLKATPQVAHVLQLSDGNFVAVCFCEAIESAGIVTAQPQNTWSGKWANEANANIAHKETQLHHELEASEKKNAELVGMGV